jgi:hypothetical protein
MSGKKQRVGTRAQVWHETAIQTTGGLKKHDLIMNKNGRIVSRAKHNTAKKEMRLLKFGYGTKKGKFGFVRKNGSKSRTNSKSSANSRSRSRSRSRKMRGGVYGNLLSPANSMSNGIDGAGITDSLSQGSPLTQALTAAGGSRHRRRGGGHSKMRGVGGSGMGYLSPADVMSNGIDGAGITQSLSQGGPLTRALTAGGRRRRHRGGTTKPFADLSSASPLNAALTH